jgi:pimeloyl-ACP methyl ester carboxylesterase
MISNQKITTIAKIPKYDFGGKGDVIHFAHANGYPPESYKQLIKPLTQEYNVIGMVQRPLWKNSDYNLIKNWQQLADDMIRFFDERSMSGVVGLGHSLGAVVSVLAADKRPDLFKQLILIEPVLFPKLITTINHIMPMAICKKYVPVAKVALRRRDHWSSEQEIFDSYRKKKIFSLMSDVSIWDWIKAGIIPDPKGGVTLRFTKEWEAHMYATVSYSLDAIDRLKIPFYIMRGERTNVISDTTWRKLHSKYSDNQLIEYKDTTHLLPLELPEKVAADIMTIIKSKKENEV